MICASGDAHWGIPTKKKTSHTQQQNPAPADESHEDTVAPPSKFQRMGWTYIPGAADDSDTWGLGLTSALFWKNRDFLFGRTNRPSITKTDLEQKNETAPRPRQSYFTSSSSDSESNDDSISDDEVGAEPQPQSVDGSLLSLDEIEHRVREIVASSGSDSARHDHSTHTETSTKENGSAVDEDAQFWRLRNEYQLDCVSSLPLVSTAKDCVNSQFVSPKDTIGIVRSVVRYNSTSQQQAERRLVLWVEVSHRPALPPSSSLTTTMLR